MKTEAKRWLSDLLECDPEVIARHPVGGGDINHCERLESPMGARLFVKRNASADILKSEAFSLTKLRKQGATHYPAVVDCQSHDGATYLALEYIELAAFNPSTARMAADCLFRQHQICHQQYGWFVDNFIGFTVQKNTWSSSWPAFFAQQRLSPQIQLATKNGLSRSTIIKLEWLVANLDRRIDVSAVRPALLHGDLWTGNLSATQARLPCFYDPAPYFGDPEVDIAMTKMFGQLPIEFYQTYRELAPEPYDLAERVGCYTLYHALNHFNMFGTSYHAMVDKMIDTLF